MTITTELEARDLWLLTTDERGTVTLSFHRVWDADRFMAAREKEAAELNREKESVLAGAHRISQERYETLRSVPK